MWEEIFVFVSVVDVIGNLKLWWVLNLVKWIVCFCIGVVENKFVLLFLIVVLILRVLVKLDFSVRRSG